MGHISRRLSSGAVAPKSAAVVKRRSSVDSKPRPLMPGARGPAQLSTEPVRKRMDLVVGMWLGVYAQYLQTLKKFKDPNMTWNGTSPLAAEGEKGCVPFLRSLHAAGAKPDELTIIDEMKPIEYAAKARDLDGVTFLFPLTHRISSYLDWSINGIKMYCHISEAFVERWRKKYTIVKPLEEKGEIAMKQKDYLVAAKCFTEVKRFLLRRCRHRDFVVAGG